MVFCRIVAFLFCLSFSHRDIRSDALKIDFDLGGLQQFLIDYDKDNAPKRNSSLESYNIIIEQCRVNINRFWQKGTNNDYLPSCKSNECWGGISTANYKTADGRSVIQEFEIRPGIVKKILEDNKFDNFDTCAAAWKDKGLINYEAGHNTRKRVIDPNLKTKEHVVVFRIFAD